MLIGQVIVELVLIVIADRCDVEELDVVTEADPETSIVTILPFDLLLRAVSPLL